MEQAVIDPFTLPEKAIILCAPSGCGITVTNSALIVHSSPNV